MSAHSLRVSVRCGPSLGRGPWLCALRSLLRYLHVPGLIGCRLTGAVPAVADLRDRGLPRGLELAAGHAKLLESCDRRRSGGRRDYAILMLLARLGLRAARSPACELEDLDWRAGELVVRGKGGRDDVLPLPTAVSYCTSVDPVFGCCGDVA